MRYAYNTLVVKPEMKVLMKIDLKGIGVLPVCLVLQTLDIVHLSACTNMT
jgi:hypothetical protein